MSSDPHHVLSVQLELIVKVGQDIVLLVLMDRPLSQEVRPVKSALLDSIWTLMSVKYVQREHIPLMGHLNVLFV